MAPARFCLLVPVKNSLSAFEQQPLLCAAAASLLYELFHSNPNGQWAFLLKQSSKSALLFCHPRQEFPQWSGRIQIAAMALLGTPTALPFGNSAEEGRTAKKEGDDAGG
jgi:hypothetical protein